MEGTKEKNKKKVAKKSTTSVESFSWGGTTSAQKKLRRELCKNRIKMKLAMRNVNGGRKTFACGGEGPSLMAPTTLNLFPDPLELTLAPPPMPAEMAAAAAAKGKEIAVPANVIEFGLKLGNGVEVEAAAAENMNMVGGDGGDERFEPFLMQLFPIN